MSDAYEELRAHRADMVQFFASKGWELLLKWAEAQARVEFEKAIRGATPEEREAARVEGLAIEKVIRLPFFMAEHAGINTAKGAFGHSDQTTPDA